MLACLKGLGPVASSHHHMQVAVISVQWALRLCSSSAENREVDVLRARQGFCQDAVAGRGYYAERHTLILTMSAAPL